MKLPNKVYDVLKWCAIVAFPAFEVFIPRLFEIWGFPLGEQIANTIAAVAILIGSLLCISSVTYNKEDK